MRALFSGGYIHPMNENKTYKYLGIERNKIIYIGNDEPKEKYNKRVELEGKHIYPTLTDSHLHLLYTTVLSATSFNICKIEKDGVTPNTIKGIEESIREYVRKNPKNDLIMVNQYILMAIDEKRLPTKFELDSWTDNKEVVVYNIDGHSCALSSKVLEKLEIESEDGILSGSEYDLNQGRITSYSASKVNLKVLAKGVMELEKECVKYGIGKVCALDGEDDGDYDDYMLSILSFVSRRMRIGVRLYPQYMNNRILDKFKTKMSRKRIGGCSKCELDGSIGSHSASFYYPFKDNGKMTEPYYDESVIKERIKETLSNGIQPTFHAIGTRAIDQIVNAYKENEALIGNTGPMPRIDHFEFPSQDAIDFVSKNRIAITFQPGYAYIDKRYLHSYENHLNEDNMKYIAPLKTMVEKGICVLGSTDSPVQSINPFEQIRGMVDYYKEDESISAFEALKTYTINPSLALDEEDGRLEIGHPASFMITEYDVLSLSKDEIANVRCNAVYIDGKRVKVSSNWFTRLISLIFSKPHKI